MKTIIEFFHHLFNPHCEICDEKFELAKIEKIELESCQSCKTLKIQLEIANLEKKQLLDSILSFTKPEIVQAPATIIEPIMPKTVPWNVKRRILEEEDRRKAEILRAYNRDNLDNNQLKNQTANTNADIEELERELGINSDNPEGKKEPEWDLTKRRRKDDLKDAV